jgi:methionyl-tRNA formyltransferase
MRIVYFSSRPSDLTNVVVQSLQEAGQEVLLVVTTPGPSRRPMESYKDVVQNKLPGVDILVTSHISRLEGMLRELEPDLIFVTGFPWRLPAGLLALPKLGSINTHPALLPKYRGPDPTFWHMMNGEKEIGLTVHRMDAEFDTGPILAQATMPIDPDWYIEEMEGNLGILAAQVIPKAFAAVAAGEPGTPQSTEGASYAPLRSEEDRKLDWGRTAEQLRNRVRAWGRMGAVGRLDGRDWEVKRARVTEERGGKADIGSVVQLGQEERAVQTGEGLLVLEEAEPL